MLDGFELHRIVSVPRRDDSSTRTLEPGLFAAWIAAHAQLVAEPNDPGVLVAWGRAAGTHEVAVDLGGRPFMPGTPRPCSAGSDPHSVLFPPGTTARHGAAPDLEDRCSALGHWIACTGQPDALWTPAQVDQLAPATRGSFDEYVAHIDGPFMWLLHAVPEPPAVLDGTLASLATWIAQARRRENSELDRVRCAAAESRYRELTRAKSSGLWRIRILAGGTSAAGARSAAALLCGASELHGLPYILAPGSHTTSFHQAWTAPGPQPATPALDPAAAFHGTAELLAAIGRPPTRELPGIRATAPPDFDVTPEHTGHDGPVLGDVLDTALRPAGEFAVPRPSTSGCRAAYGERVRRRISRLGDRCTGRTLAAATVAR